MKLAEEKKKKKMKREHGVNHREVSYSFYRIYKKNSFAVILLHILAAYWRLDLSFISQLN